MPVLGNLNSIHVHKNILQSICTSTSLYIHFQAESPLNPSSLNSLLLGLFETNLTGAQARIGGCNNIPVGILFRQGPRESKRFRRFSIVT